LLSQENKYNRGLRASSGKAAAAEYARAEKAAATRRAYRTDFQIRTWCIERRVPTRRLTARSVADIVKARARRAGLDPKQFAGHSLRSGFLTSAAARGASIFKMADQSRHKSMDTLRGYVRDAEIFKRHAGEGLL
jgi:site-specific recombinase XerD